MSTVKKGFTLIELLIVVVIIGVLAAIAIPKFANTKNRSLLATMQSDLHNLITVQEAYFSDNNGTYASSVADLATNYRTSSGVTIAFANVTASTWQATATHVASAKTCTISLGGGATNEGVPVCQ